MTADRKRPPGEAPIRVPAPAPYDGVGRALRHAFNQSPAEACREFERLLSLLR